MAKQANTQISTDGDVTQQGSRGGGPVEAAQQAAERVVSVAGSAAERLPEAVGNAQRAADDTARALEQMPDRTLVLGTTFSLGVGTGLFLSGTNRVMVLLALMPAVAMAATLVARGERPMLTAGNGRSS